MSRAESEAPTQFCIRHSRMDKHTEHTERMSEATRGRARVPRLARESYASRREPAREKMDTSEPYVMLSLAG